MPIQLSPFFGQRQQAPFQAQPQQPQGADPRLLLGLAQGAQGFLQGGQQGGLGAALLGLGSGALGGVAQGQFMQQERAQQQQAAQAAAQQQALENQRAQQEAQRKAAADAETVRQFGITSGQKQRAAQEGIRQFGITEGRLGRAAGVDEELMRGNLAARQGELGLRRNEFERGPKPDLQVETVRLPDGTVRSFRRDDPALDQALGQGGIRFSAQLQSPDVAGLGGATTSTQTRAQSTLDAASDTLGVIQQFRESLRPENIGLSGNLRELGIGTLGQAESFRAWADDQTQGIIDQAISSGDTLDLSKFAVDPELSSQRLLENVLAYRLAKIQDPDGRISDQDFRNAKLSLGTGKKLSSIGDVLARVDAFEKTVQRTQGIAQQRLGLQPQGPQPATTSPAIANRRQSLGVSQEDLEFTAQQNGLTVEQVLDQLEAR
ncbi:MAG: hypothetical protein ACR2RF_31340 [Geminicoccaceae bacterium]